VIGKVIPLRYSRERGVVKIKKILWLKKAMVSRPRSSKLQEKIASLFTRPECFHKRVFAGDCSNRHTGSRSLEQQDLLLCHIHLLFASDWDAHIRPWESPSFQGFIINIFIELR
jgi:hypothetical protein